MTSDAVRLNKVLAKVLVGMRPPENLTVSEWADKKRRLSPESSAEIGPWRTSRTPYLKEIMDAFTDPKVSCRMHTSRSSTAASRAIKSATRS